MPRSLIAAAVVLITAPCVYSQQWSLDSLPQYRPGQTVSGTIRSWGNDQEVSLMKYWEEGFRKYHPGIRFEDNLKTTAVAIPGLVTGLADLGVMGREIFPMEETAYRLTHDNNVPLIVTVGTGSYDVMLKTWAMVVFVHKDNPISKLTMNQLDGIFGSERTGGWDEAAAEWLLENGRSAEQNIRTWGELGLMGEWKDKPIQVYGYDLTRNGFPFAFAQKVFKGGDKWNENLKEFVAIRRPDGTTWWSGEQVLHALGKDRYGITFSLISFKTPLVKPIAVAPRDRYDRSATESDYVVPTKETVQDRTYPLFRSIYICVNRAPGKPVEPKLKEFLRFILSREGQQAVVREGDYLPLTLEVVREELKKVE